MKLNQNINKMKTETLTFPKLLFKFIIGCLKYRNYPPDHKKYLKLSLRTSVLSISALIVAIEIMRRRKLKMQIKMKNPKIENNLFRNLFRQFGLISEDD